MAIRQVLTVLGAGVLLAIGGVALPACSGGTDPKQEPRQSGPAAAVETLERALARDDCAGVKKIVVGPEQIDCGFIAEAAAAMAEVDLDAAIYAVIDVGDDTATVRIDLGDGEKQDLDLVRMSGAWLVIFDTAA